MTRLIPVFVVLALGGVGRVAQAQVCDSAAAATAECDAPQAAFAAGIERDWAELNARVAPLLDPRVAQQAMPLPLREDELPWCNSAEDPRCAPLRSNSAPAGGDGRVTAAVAAETPPAGVLPQLDQGFTACFGLLPHAGVNHRVERPPRA